MYNIGALRKFQVFMFTNFRDVTFAIPESGFKIKIHGVRSTDSRSIPLYDRIGVDVRMYRRLDYILHDYNYELEPCCTVLPDRLQPAGYRVVR